MWIEVQERRRLLGLFKSDLRLGEVWMNDKKWPVVPICDKQLLDVKPEHLVDGGLFRLCDTYKGGGGYDQYPTVCESRIGVNPGGLQFVAQLRGCPLKCPYCYVTPSGIWGKAEYVSTKDMLSAYLRSDASIFHLMGGAPALYLEYWLEISTRVNFFHSDFLLVEKHYRPEWLIGLSGVHAVSLKDFPVDFDMLWSNLDMLVDCGVNFYLTFTGVPMLREQISKRYGSGILADSFVIPVNNEYQSLGMEKTK